MKNLFKFLATAFIINSVTTTTIYAQAQQQCTFTAVSNGNFSSPGTFSSTCGGTPTSGSDDIIIINGFNVTLDVNYQVGKNGSITLSGGSLIGGSNLALGDGSGSQTDTQLLIGQGSAVRVAQLTVNKGTVVVSNSSASLTTDCNLVLVNSDITDNGQAIINGSIDLTRGGANNKLCGTGSVQIRGCVFGSNGATNRLADNCASSLITLCARKITTGCPGPVEATNASELECQNIVTCVTAPLPVELVAFTATLTAKQQVALHWATASEKNSKHFVVERSFDGKVFREVGTIAAAGNTQAYSQYNFTDEQPLPGNSYYRLKQADLDGTIAYSPVRTVKLGSASSEYLSVYPGRSVQEWVVSTTLPAEALAAPAAVQVFDALGRVQRVTCTPDATQTGRWTLDLRALPTGVYIVRLVTASGSFSQRIAQ